MFPEKKSATKMPDGTPWPPMDRAAAQHLAGDILARRGWYAVVVTTGKRDDKWGILHAVKAWRFLPPETAIHVLQNEGEWDALRKEMLKVEGDMFRRAAESAHHVASLLKAAPDGVQETPPPIIEEAPKEGAEDAKDRKRRARRGGDQDRAHQGDAPGTERQPLRRRRRRGRQLRLPVVPDEAAGGTPGD